jgi:parallel beta-helix repeat protein
MVHSVNKKEKRAGRVWLLCLLALIVGGALPGAMPRAAAQPLPLPPVVYSPGSNTIYIGANYSTIDPAQAPYVEFPSHELAPKSAITLPEVDQALTLQSLPDLIENQGSVWTLKADVIISQTARLDVTLPAVGLLRLSSDSSGGQPLALTRVIARGGHLNIQGDAPTSRIRVFSWDPASPDPEGRDTVVDNGRSFLLADLGGRMDLVNAEVSHLGWSPGEPSGLSWRKMARKNGNPTLLADIQTGATGSIINSDIHNNYFGQYSYEAYGLEVRNNEFRDNLYYGFDPHDYSTKFVVADNKVYNNGNHGIIFSRGCTLNLIINNEVYGNANHGIMLDRGSNNNEISGNLVYNNTDGVAIFQSSNNLIKSNILRDNVRGVRVNATYDNDDIFDGISANNTITENVIQNNSQYGIYLYERADENIITANDIIGSVSAGIYIKTGGNLIQDNSVEQNGHGISIIGGEYVTPPLGGPPYVTPLSQPGLDNVIWSNTLDNNTGMGIQVKGGTNTVIGALDPAAHPEQANLIRTNGTYGVGLTDGTSGTQLNGNTIHGNTRNGVLVKGSTSVNNRLSRNSIAANAEAGIAISDGANNGIVPPEITSAPDALTVTGNAPANSTVELYRDANGQGAVYKGATTANGSGQWSFQLPDGDNQQPGYISAIVIDQSGDTSAFATNAPSSLKAIYTVGSGNNGELTVFVNGPGALITLPDIQTALQTISPTVTLLENQGGGVWQLNASLFLNRGVTLSLTGDTASWLKLRSQADNIVLAAGEANYNYQSFAALRTYGGAILIDGVRITSWDPAANDYDRDISNGRSYLLAKYDARMDIKNAELSYLGSSDGESYGIAWRDINDTDAPEVLRTRVTGDVVNSVFSYNYYGIYTYQASNMLFKNNKFHNNIGYGFDPHDFSTGFIVEDNEAFENGNHGFIISRGCNNFVFRNNKSYNNRYSVDEQDRNAHGFMLDPGSPNSRYPQEPSFSNLLENNEAWGNDGYGLRVVGSIDNTIRGNRFTGNLQGITLEQASTGNVVENNTITGSTLYGIYLIGGSDQNTLKGNTITGSGKHGIYIKTGNNTIVGNTLRSNGLVTEVGPSGSGIAFLPDLPSTAAADLMLPGMAGLASADPELLSVPALASALTDNLIQSNTITKNADDGIELKGALNTTITQNTISYNGVHGAYFSDYEGQGATGNVTAENTFLGNGGHGIRANGTASLGNVWRANSVSGNGAGGITNTSSANNGIKPPKLGPVVGTTVTGTTVPGARVEIFSDFGNQARFFEGTTTAGADGTFSFTASQAWKGTVVNATATDSGGNSSGLAIDKESRIVYLPIVRR